MRESDQTCLGLFFLSLVFWLMTSGFSLTSLAEITQAPSVAQTQDAERVQSVLTEK